MKPFCTLICKSSIQIMKIKKVLWTICLMWSFWFFEGLKYRNVCLNQMTRILFKEETDKRVLEFGSPKPCIWNWVAMYQVTTALHKVPAQCTIACRSAVTYGPVTVHFLVYSLLLWSVNHPINIKDNIFDWMVGCFVFTLLRLCFTSLLLTKDHLRMTMNRFLCHMYFI